MCMNGFVSIEMSKYITKWNNKNKETVQNNNLLSLLSCPIWRFTCHRKNGFLNSYHDPKFAHAVFVYVYNKACHLWVLNLNLANSISWLCSETFTLLLIIYFFGYRIITTSYLVSKQSTPTVFPKLCVYLFQFLN